MNEQSSPSPRRAAAKIVVSVLVALHLLAVIAAPYSMPPSSSTSRSLFACLQPYIQACYLNHGYHFFAPDPGPSSLIEYTTVDANNQRHWTRMPNRQTDWPRLYYHRRFMLTEFYGSVPPAATEMRQSIAGAYAAHVLRTTGASQVEMSRVVHELSSREEILQGGSLVDESKYDVTPLGTFSPAP